MICALALYISIEVVLETKIYPQLIFFLNLYFDKF